VKGSKNGGKKKWYFNPVGIDPTNSTDCETSGVDCDPICEKPEYYVNNVTNECDTAGGYQHITYEDTCRTAAWCLSECTEEQFRVLSGSDEENAAPKGCHIDSSGCVAFNGIKGTPTGPSQGTPICNLTVSRGEEFLMNATKKPETDE
jgi:hypothetical protein